MAYQSWSVVFGEQPSAAKWNILGTNDVSFNDGSGIASDAIHPNHLATGLSSTTWAWASWTPTWTNLTIGNGTNDAKYIQIGKTVIWRLVFDFGSTTSISGNPIFSLPVTSVTVPNTSLEIGSGSLNTGSGAWNGWARWASTTTSALRYWDGNNNQGDVSATSPAAYGDSWAYLLQGRYEAA